MNTQVRIGDMLRQSLDVILHPSIYAFRRYAPRSSDSDALTYVAIAAFLVAIVSAFFFGGGGLIGVLYAVLNNLFGFYIFAGIMYFVAKQFGGGGDFITVAYLFSLFYVPILLITWAVSLALVFAPGVAGTFVWVQLLGLVAQAFYAYLAIQAAMYIRRKRDALIAVAIGFVVLWVVQQILGGLAAL